MIIIWDIAQYFIMAGLFVFVIFCISCILATIFGVAKEIIVSTAEAICDLFSS